MIVEGYQVYFLGEENLLELDCDDTLGIFYKTLSYVFKKGEF